MLLIILNLVLDGCMLGSIFHHQMRLSGKILIASKIP